MNWFRDGNRTEVDIGEAAQKGCDTRGHRHRSLTLGQRDQEGGPVGWSENSGLVGISRGRRCSHRNEVMSPMMEAPVLLLAGIVACWLSAWPPRTTGQVRNKGRYSTRRETRSNLRQVNGDGETLRAEHFVGGQDDQNGYVHEHFPPGKSSRIWVSDVEVRSADIARILFRIRNVLDRIIDCAIRPCTKAGTVVPLKWFEGIRSPTEAVPIHRWTPPTVFVAVLKYLPMQQR